VCGNLLQAKHTTSFSAIGTFIEIAVLCICGYHLSSGRSLVDTIKIVHREFYYAFELLITRDVSDKSPGQEQ
jgi:hypothetical protein